MNTLIVYDSTFGNTEHLAQVIADRLAAYGMVRLFRVPQDAELHTHDTDVLIVGGPTQHHGTSEAMQAFLDGLPRLSLYWVKAAAFDTRYHMAAWQSGSAASKIASTLKRAGATLIVPPESFFVTEREGPLEPGEAWRAEQWAEQIVAAFAAENRTEQPQVETS
jgi:flavodoxin